MDEGRVKVLPAKAEELLRSDTESAETFATTIEVSFLYDRSKREDSG